MAYLEYRVRAQSPLLISDYDNGSNMTSTLDYITGNTILGLFAGNYIRKTGVRNAHEDERFYSWFLGGGISFLNAYLLIYSEYEPIRVSPTPLSIQINKDGTTIYNLIDEDRKEQTKAIGGFANVTRGSYDEDGSRIIFASTKKDIFFHHKRDNRLKGHSYDGNIFYYEGIQEGQVFSGFLKGTKEDLQEFKEFFGERMVGWVGKSRNAQYGRIELELMGVKDSGSTSKVQRLLDETYMNDGELVLELLSPAIFYNSMGIAEPSASSLKKYLEEKLGCGVDIEECFAKTEPIENFVSIWKLKKPMEQAFTAGSTFKIKIREDLYDYESSVTERLANLLSEGIGERRHEGFGQISIKTRIPKFYIEANTEKIIKKPHKEPPEVLQAILRDVIMGDLVNNIRIRGMNRAGEFCNRPPNHLLGRLESLLSADHGRECYQNFQRDISALRDRAKDSLEKCKDKNDRRNLLMEMKAFSIDPVAKAFLGEREAILEISGWDYMDDTLFKDKLYEEYWLSFFRMMRKLNKEGD